MSTRGGTLVIETFAFDGGRGVTAFVPDEPASAVIYAGDGQLIAPWGQDLAAAGQTSIMIVGVHRSDDETLRLHEYSPRFDPDRFGAHEAFLLGDVRDWVRGQVFSVQDATFNVAYVCAITVAAMTVPDDGHTAVLPVIGSVLYLLGIVAVRVLHPAATPPIRSQLSATGG